MRKNSSAESLLFSTIAQWTPARPASRLRFLSAERLRVFLNRGIACWQWPDLASSSPCCSELLEPDDDVDLEACAEHDDTRDVARYNTRRGWLALDIMRKGQAPEVPAL